MIWVCDKIKKTVTTVGAGHAHSSGGHEVSPIFLKNDVRFVLTSICIVVGFMVY